MTVGGTYRQKPKRTVRCNKKKKKEGDDLPSRRGKNRTLRGGKRTFYGCHTSQKRVQGKNLLGRGLSQYLKEKSVLAGWWTPHFGTQTSVGTQ